MKKLVLLTVIVLFLVWALWPRTHSASVQLEPGALVTMTIWPMQGIHSDWHRSLEVSYDGQRVKRRLFGDSGWWRGSNLYRHALAGGTYLLHEGQGGCVGFTLEPLRFDPALEHLCPTGGGSKRGDHDLPPGDSLLTYLGHFFEAPRSDQRVKYSPSGEAPEKALPDGP